MNISKYLIYKYVRAYITCTVYISMFIHLQYSKIHILSPKA